MEQNNTRISKLREYLLGVIDEMTNSTDYQINANMLSNDVGDYSIDKIPTEKGVEHWILASGPAVNKDVYSFRSRKKYSQDVIDNLNNIGFFEEFERIIQSNNDKGILPEIENIETIECLNCGTMQMNDDGNTSVFDIQIQITYRNANEHIISL